MNPLSKGSSTIFIIDDDVSVRTAMASLFESVGMAVRIFSSGSDILSQLDKLTYDSPDRPNCMIIDVRMPDIDGLELQQLLVLQQLDLSIIFVSGYGDVAMTVQAMKAGACDFLPKPFRDQDMLDAVRSALIRDSKRRDAEAKLRVLKDRYASLTVRERTVLRLVTRGLMNKQIASEMALSEITVKVYRGLLMKKMKARSLAELVKMEQRLPKTIQ